MYHCPLAVRDEFVKTEMKLDSNEAFKSIANSTANDTSLSEQNNETSEGGVVKNGRKFPSAAKSKMKIPPTQKDVRKLFVGGIGRDGKFSSSAVRDKLFILPLATFYSLFNIIFLHNCFLP